MHARHPFFLRLLLGLSLLLGLAGLANAQATAPEPTVEQIYQTASSGNLPRANAMIDEVLQRHPDSAKAHYVKAELAARGGDVVLAARELSTAERLAPGLPFARQESVQALRARVEGTSSPGETRRMGAPPREAAPERSSAGLSWTPLIVGAGIVLVALAVLRRRASNRGPTMAMGTGSAEGSTMGSRAGWPSQPGPAVPPGAAPGYDARYDPRYDPRAARPGMGGAILGGLGTGLAVGAGALAAQEIGRRMLERGEEQRGHGAGAQDLSGMDSAALHPDLGGENFGIQDPGASWDEGSNPAGGDDFGIGEGAGDDWNT